MKTKIIFLMLLSLIARPVIAESKSTIEAPELSENSGRKSKTNDAAALAMFGAAMAGASCVMLMKQAMKQLPGSMERAMLMSQAMQQCAQAMKSAADGQSNDNIADYLTSQGVDVPELTEGPAAAANSANPNAISNIPPKTGEGRGIASVDPGPEVKIDGAAKPFDRSALTMVDPRAGKLEFGVPNMIDGSKLTFDEFAAAGGESGTNGGVGTIVGLAQKGEIDFNATNQKSEAELDEQARRKRHITDSAGDSLTASAGTAAAASDDMSGLMNSFMGGGAESGGADLGSSEQIISFGDDSGQVKVNIFQYASYRYKTLAHNEGRIQSRLSTGIKF